MKKYKFIRNNNEFIWTNDIIKLQFSKPLITRWNEFKPGNIKENGIHHYFYEVKIFNKIYSGYPNNNDELMYKWRTVSKRNTLDFPKIEELQVLLNYILKLNPVKNGQKIKYIHDKIEYRETINTEGFACDDFYEITKITNDKGLEPKYNLYMGCTFDFVGDCNSTGIRIEYLTEEDVKELLKCVNSFIDFSIDESNKEIEKHNFVHKSGKEIINEQLIEYTIEDDLTLNKNKIESIYIIGDTVNIRTINEKYKNVVITNINMDDNTICLDSTINLKINDIIYIFNQVPDSKVYYSINEIANDFYSILTEAQKEEFKNNEMKIVFDKYMNAIINRTWMNRYEHNFPCSVEESVKEIVNIINKKGH